MTSSRQVGSAIGLACLSALALACGHGEAPRAPAASAPRVELNVYAAASTREALQALAGSFTREHGLDLVFNFGSSGDLARQIIAAGKADVFLSAGEPEMDAVERAGLLVAGTRRVLLSNQLVVVEPADRPSIFVLPFDASQLARERVKRLSLANVETVPAGRYAKAWLESQGIWPSVSARVLSGVDVRAALAAVESSGADAGIVYRTDVARSARARIAFAVPLDEGPRISYSIAVIHGRSHGEQARAYVAFLGSDRARAAVEDLGFLFVPAGAPALK